MKECHPAAVFNMLSAAMQRNSEGLALTASPLTAMAGQDAIVARNGETLHYHATVAFDDWMTGSTLLLDGVDEGCCSAVRTSLGLIADNLMVPESDFTSR